MNNNPSNEASIYEDPNESLRDKLASIMHDSGKYYLMIDRNERQENNYRLADEALKLIAHHNRKQYGKQLLQRVEDEAMQEDPCEDKLDAAHAYMFCERCIFNDFKVEQRSILKRLRTSIEKGE